MSAKASIRAAASTCVESTRVFLRDVGAGLLEVSHNSLALLGLVVVGVALFAGGRAEIRTLVEQQALDWLLARQEARDPQAADVQPEPEPDADVGTEPEGVPA